MTSISRPAGAGWTPAAIAAKAADGGAEQAARPFNGTFPFLNAVYQMGNIYRSNYNALQATLTARNFHGLSAIVGYTYAHALDDVGANWDFGQGLGLPQDSAHPQREYASSDFDIRHRFTLSMTYLVPGKKSFAQLLEGWQLNSIVTLNSAQPWGPTDSSTDVSGTGASTTAATGIERWDFFGNPGDFTSGPVGIPYFSGTSNPACVAKATTLAMQQALGLFGCFAKGSSVMIPPGFTFGTMGRNLFRDSGFRNWDFSVAKNWKLGRAPDRPVPCRVLQYSQPPQLRQSLRWTKWFRDGRLQRSVDLRGRHLWLWLCYARQSGVKSCDRFGRSPATQFGLKFSF